MKIEYEISICTLIEKIENNYGMYVGGKTLTGLSHFLDGYRYRFYEEDQYLFLFQIEFQSYVEAKYQLQSGCAWSSIILKDLQEDCAFDAFFCLFKQFLKETAYGRMINKHR